MKKLMLACMMLSVIAMTWAQIPEPPPPPPDPSLPSTTVPVSPESVRGAVLAISDVPSLRLVNRIGRSFRFLNISTLTTAGPAIEDLTLFGDFTYASFDDSKLDGDGNDWAESVYLTGTFATDFSFGLGITESQYHLDGDLVDIDQQMYSVDGYLMYAITEELQIGGFLQWNTIDIENDTYPAAVPGGFATVGDSYERYGAGLIATWRHDRGAEELFGYGVTTSLASFNKQTMADFFDDEDTAWITVVDVEHGLTDNLSIDLYATFFTLLDNQDSEVDSTYWTLGFDLAYQVGENWLVSAGLETEVGLADYRERRFNATVAYTW